jgi:Glucose-6-phosphate dehydrogenase subunit N-terminal domain/Glucose-6-phosphate dehydrogenase subunit C-terminal domain
MVETAHVDEWHGEDVSLAEVQRQLCAMRASSAEDQPDLRTSVMTHTAWVPHSWLDAARGALAGLAEKHPSRTILIVPEPDAGRDAIDADLSVYCFDLEGETRHVCSEVIELHLGGTRAHSPASVIEPLLISDLPVFSRWRGRPSFGSREFEQIVRVVDRLIVDSTEWDDLPAAYAELERCFDETAVSDIAWRRSLGWRATLATLWPGIADLGKIRIEGPTADALLLAGWLRSRLRRDVKLEHEEADELRSITADGDEVPPPRGERPDASALLSAELDQFGRDPIYEEALRAAQR